MYMKLLKASHKYIIVNKLGEWQTGSNSENVIKYIFPKYNIKICASVCGWERVGKERNKDFIGTSKNELCNFFVRNVLFPESWL